MPLPLDIHTDVDQDGHLPKVWRKRLADQLKLYAGGDVRIRISKPKRSSGMNRLYWGYRIDPIRRAMIEAGAGYMMGPEGKVVPVSAAMIHEVFKGRYLPVRTAVVFGREVTLPPSTADLDSTTMADYLRAIEQDEDVLALGVYFEESPSRLEGRLEDLPY